MSDWWIQAQNIYSKYSTLYEQEKSGNYRVLGSESEIFYKNKPILDLVHEIWKLESDIKLMRIQINEANDDEIEAIGELEIIHNNNLLVLCKNQLKDLIEQKPDINHITMEIRAGTGGVEASLFAEDLSNMYLAFTKRKNWKIDTISCSKNISGGIKEVVFNIEGTNCYQILQYESGVHRVQRVPSTESKGRTHTSAATVSVLPQEHDDLDSMELLDEDLEIETCRAGGAGGQHVNTTDSAVKMRHKPTGLMAICQDERSQLKNKEKARRNLLILIKNKLREESSSKRNSERNSQIGSGDRSEKIRTFNFNQNRVTDHRSGHSCFNIEDFLNGGKSMEEMIESLQKAHNIEVI